MHPYPRCSSGWWAAKCCTVPRDQGGGGGRRLSRQQTPETKVRIEGAIASKVVARGRQRQASLPRPATPGVAGTKLHMQTPAGRRGRHSRKRSKQQGQGEETLQKVIQQSLATASSRQTRTHPCFLAARQAPNLLHCCVPKPKAAQVRPRLKYTMHTYNKQREGGEHV